MKKTGIWSPGAGVNYTLTATEIEGHMIEKLQNKTLRVTTGLVRICKFILSCLFNLY